MFGLGWQELLIILVIIVIIFGAGKLPEMGSALGKGIKEFKETAKDGSLPEGENAPAGGTVASSTSSNRRQDETVIIERRELRADEI
jgi:sec-independent protein translocase protein TatA